MRGVPIYLEVGAKRVIAGAVEWPGWCRSARTEKDAVAALAAYADRYRTVVDPAVGTFKPPKDASELTIVERLKGNATTDFGVPALGLPTDVAPIADAELERLARLVQAAWAAFDRAAKAARGRELRKGPRGGGRDLDKIVEHVTEAEKMYLVKLGARPPTPAGGRALRSEEQRAAIAAGLRARARGRPVAQPSAARTLWTPRYFMRRAAWHVLDHAWEIEDRVAPR